jgi:hypothetical protein
MFHPPSLTRALRSGDYTVLSNQVIGPIAVGPETIDRRVPS